MQLNHRHRFDIVEIPNWEGMGLASTWAPGLRVVIRLHTSLAESIEMAERKPSGAERFTIWAERTFYPTGAFSRHPQFFTSGANGGFLWEG